MPETVPAQTPRPHAGDEFEREPVPPRALKGPSAFWGMYAGEHTAGTEFMIGPLFVAWGASAFDLVVGLLLGNLMAVLTWRYLTAEIATHKRLTLYYQLEQITGRKLVTLYNLFNGVLFCFLAGAMVTVSATAVGVAFGDRIKMPAFTDTMPTGVVWGVTCLLIGAAMTFVAVRGYGFVARVGHISAPWMLLVFVACGVVMLGKLGTANLFELIQPPRDSAGRIGFWGIVCFSWFCNAAMHLGMSDLSIFRFARKPSYGWASAAGMFLGHYIAWICAALLLVYWVRERGANPAQGVPPGPMVNDAVGIAGLFCVVIAGWTTANPTIYRAHYGHAHRRGGLHHRQRVPGVRHETPGFCRHLWDHPRPNRRGDCGGPFPRRAARPPRPARRPSRQLIQSERSAGLAHSGGCRAMVVRQIQRARLFPAAALLACVCAALHLFPKIRRPRAGEQPR